MVVEFCQNFFLHPSTKSCVLCVWVCVQPFSIVWVNLIEFQILSQLCIPEINHSWSQYYCFHMLLHLICSLFASLFMRDSVVFFPCIIFVWFGCQGNAGLSDSFQAWLLQIVLLRKDFVCVHICISFYWVYNQSIIASPQDYLTFSNHNINKEKGKEDPI